MPDRSILQKIAIRRGGVIALDQLCRAFCAAKASRQQVAINTALPGFVIPFALIDGLT